MVAEAKGSSGAEPDAVQRWGGRIPIVVGACGHRNIDPSNPRLIAVIEEQCAALKMRYRHSPFLILSALAEGADRLIAKVAMAKLEADLIAVLPMPADEYENDFQTEESKAEFRDLLTRALHVRTVEVPAGDAWKTPGEPRNVQYARAGAMIADQAQVLFAIWDGKGARGTGGTSDLVAWFERGYSPKEYTAYKEEVTPLDPLEPGRSVRIDPVTGKSVTVENPGSVARVKKVQAPEKSKIETILERTDEFNRAVQRSARAISASYPLADKASIRELALTDAAYHAADGVSIRFANVVRHTDARIYVLAMLAVVVFNFVSSKDWAPWTYLGVTGVMVLLGSRVLVPALDNRFHEYRCLAEALRTLFFWRAAGIASSVWLPFLARQSGVVHWIRQSARTVEFCQDCRPCSHPKLGSESFPEGLRIAKEKWVDDQATWFAGKELFHFKKHKFWSKIVQRAIVGSFATAGLIAILTLIPAAGSDDSKSTIFNEYVKPDKFTDYWQLALSLFAAGAVAARGFLLRTSHLELAKQYASQRQIFEQASRMLEAHKNEPAPEWTPIEILENLGQEALQEQAEWVWLKHTRPFEVPAG
jgi:hypothetical protein